MSWFGETNPHFWSSNQPHSQQAPPPRSPPRPAQQPAQRPPEIVHPVSIIRPRERPTHVHNAPQPTPAPEPNPHFWPRDRRQAPPAGPSGPTRLTGQQPPIDIQPEKRIRPKQRHEDTTPPPIRDPNPHFWPRDRHPSPPSDPSGSTGHPIHRPPSDIKPEKRIRPKERPQQVQMPPVPLTGPHGSTQSEPPTHGPELELVPTWPTRLEDRSPIHPTHTSQEHWPLHSELANQEGRDQPRRQPKKQQPRNGPTKTRPPRKHDPHEQPTGEHNLMYPAPNRTNPCTWFVAILCVILWVVVILGGILILTIYLFYRPRNPHFEISNAALNAAYLDMGYLLNADVVVLVNITNPNQKMNVDFNFAVLKLLYENQPIANQYVGSFSIPKSESKFATLEMVGSQIRLPVLVTQQLEKQIKKNRVTFQVEGYFHARSNLGFFHYSYWIYTHCTIITTGPPSGIMVARKCITKR